MADAMTPERAREVLGDVLYPWQQAVSSLAGTQCDKDEVQWYRRKQLEVAALTLALSALDAVARVREVCTRGPYSGSWGSGYNMALADVRSALDGEGK